MLEKHYQPNEVEDRIYKAWLDAGAFDSGRPERKDAEPYCIVIPPPNVTGSLHMGHALNNTLQDILCRFERMRGKDVLWQVGTDHAGIATQMVVERQLMEKQQHRREMGREEFLKRVWQWKEESGGTIIKQLKKLGASCDWRRERFTMDDGLSKAVLEVFVTLHKEGLIYRDKRLVNWDPKLLTAISDLEVQQVEVKGSLWHLRYPLEGKTFNAEDPSTFIVVATTRPETMLGDTGVAVHPDDERYKKLVGKNVILPLVGRKIPIVADEYSDPEKGSGAVKITPAHDFNDFEVGKRHNLAVLNIFTEDAKVDLKNNRSFLEGLLQLAPDDTEVILLGFDKRHYFPVEELLKLSGLDRFVARKEIIKLLEERDLVQKVEPNIHAVPHGDRSGVVLEPRLTDQWYVNAKKLAVDALAAVKNGKTVFVPKNWEKTYFDWLENIQPWCVSRQLWWGHQIPAWYGPVFADSNKDSEVISERYEAFVAYNEQEAIKKAEAHYGQSVELAPLGVKEPALLGMGRASGKPIQIFRDEDVLDTWFSSALWPFSTLGWPDKTAELKRYYPTQVLVTGFDIIFFWVARMMMMGMHFLKEVPFHTVYIHALVRDERGAKMSKSKGNVIDPLHLIDEYGADALRFTLAAMAAQGRDIKLSTQRVEGYRNFATKLWNAARFAEMNGAQRTYFDPKSAKETLNKWILSEAATTLKEVTSAIEAYKFNDAANAAYRFVWSVYCDWYVELMKPVLTGPDSPAKDETRATAAFVLDEIFKLLHPFMPFLTEELWGLTGQVGPKRENLLALSSWPKLEGLENEKAEAEIGWLVDLISAVRSVRSEMNVPAAQQVPLVLVGSKDMRERAGRWEDALKRLARLSEISFADKPPAGSVQLLVRGEIAAMPLKGVVDLAAERVRLEKEIAKVDADIERVDKKLGNPKFVENADEEVVDAEREKREEAVGRRAKILEALERLKGAT